jgi:altronate dehydratase
MIRILFYGLLFAFAGVAFAWADGQVVVIDHHYGSELVKMACIPKMEPACVDDKLQKLTQFEEAIRANLVSDPNCRGVTIAGLGDHPGPYWDLLIDSNSQSFRLMRLHEESNFTNYTETGTAPVIAEKVCAMVNRKKTS